MSLDITKITDFFSFNTNNLLVDNDSFQNFFKFCNYPCETLILFVNDDSLLEENISYKIDCKKALKVTIVFDAKKNILFPDLELCRNLQSLIYSGVNCVSTYNFGKHEYLNEITIRAPLTFLYKHCFQQNKMLESVNFQEILKPSILWEPLKHLKQLKSLFLLNCHIETIPKNLHFPALIFLNLKGNKLKRIPTFLKSSKNLVHLDLSFNQIEEVPSWLSKMKVEKLNLNNNCLKRFPFEILMKMEKLVEIQLKNNEFIYKDYIILPKTVTDKIRILCDSKIVTENQHDVFQKVKLIQTEKIPYEFLCPISHDIMIDPVLTVNGLCYDRYSIEKWYECNDTDPCHGNNVENKSLIPNLILKEIIHKFIKASSY